MTFVATPRPCEGPEGRLCYVQCPECKEKEMGLDKMMELQTRHKELETERKKLQTQKIDLESKIWNIGREMDEIQREWSSLLYRRVE